MRELGERSKAMAAGRLRRGLGVHGRLAPKDRRDGRPLGGSLPAVIEAGRVRPLPDGFEVAYEGRALEHFQKGSRPHGQPPRPVVGLTGAEAKALAKVALRGLANEARRLGVAS